MKLSIIVASSLVYFSVCVFTQEFIGPLENVLKEKLNLSAEDFMKKCQSKSLIIVDKLMASRSGAKIIGNALANDILHRVQSSTMPNEQTWKRVVKERCSTNSVLKVLSLLSVDTVNLCLDDGEKLSGDKRIDFGRALTRGYCVAAKKLAKEKSKAQHPK
ncbi:uncharacterized protein LOC122512391 [Leptopilina heterotoma]|uniref:uncharacterized protein LOC122512391 n=1 Tax=Leptopilina heterotoma TaxID=63436 RepID=UPI001CA894D1|nr:uncharacterized protein LOC122512391 [Leptopilina heterotoma]